MDDPFLSEDFCYQRLYDDWVKYGSIVVALDFDSTIFDLHNKGYKFPKIIELIKECNKLKFPVVIYSASAQERWGDIFIHCVNVGIEVAGINHDVLGFFESGNRKGLNFSKSKIFYSILLCDRAGLPSSYNILKRLVDNINSVS